MARKQASKNLQKLIDMLNDESADWSVKAVLEESETEASRESDAEDAAVGSSDSSEAPQETEENSQNQTKADAAEKTDQHKNQK